MKKLLLLVVLGAIVALSVSGSANAALPCLTAYVPQGGGTIPVCYHWPDTARPTTFKAFMQASTDLSVWNSALTGAKNTWDDSGTTNFSITQLATKASCQVNNQEMGFCAQNYTQGNFDAAGCTREAWWPPDVVVIACTSTWLWYERETSLSPWYLGPHLAQTMVSLDTVWQGGVQPTTVTKNSMVCHEMGHSLGLMHTQTNPSSTGSCLTSIVTSANTTISGVDTAGGDISLQVNGNHAHNDPFCGSYNGACSTPWGNFSVTQGGRTLMGKRQSLQLAFRVGGIPVYVVPVGFDVSLLKRDGSERYIGRGGSSALGVRITTGKDAHTRAEQTLFA